MKKIGNFGKSKKIYVFLVSAEPRGPKIMSAAVGVLSVLGQGCHRGSKIPKSRFRIQAIKKAEQLVVGHAAGDGV